MVNNTVNIYIVDGTYNETISIKGFTGSGSINIYGHTGAIGDYLLLNNIIITNCGCTVLINGFKPTSTTAHGIVVNGCPDVTLLNTKVDATASSYAALQVANSNVYVDQYSYSNRGYGILANRCAIITACNGAGSGNTIGLSATFASTIGKYSSAQCTGTTNELTVSGGTIK